MKKEKGKVKREGFAYRETAYYGLAGVSVAFALLFFFLAFGQYEVQPARGG